MTATSVPEPQAALAPRSRHTRVPWAMLFCVLLFLLLLTDRYRYLSVFGFVYTDCDQVTYWNQSWDIARGIIREPCLYGQSYNVPVEAWLAAPLLFLGVPPYFALPVIAALLALFPFVWLAILAIRRGHPWGGAILLLIPLALPVEYMVVSSLPRGFINGIAVATPAVVFWAFHQSRRTFFLAGFFAVASLIVNPSGVIILLAACVYALLVHWRRRSFYLYSFLGGLLASPGYFLIKLFYRWHPECDFYSPGLTMCFRWETLNKLFFSGDGRWVLNHQKFDLFFAHFVPIAHRGWIMLVILLALVFLLLAVLHFRMAVAVLIASVFAIACLGFDRLHSASLNVFYSGSRMYLALPVLFALALLWFDMGLRKTYGKRLRLLVPVARIILIAGLIALALVRDLKPLEAPSPFVEKSFLPPVESVATLRADSQTAADLCKEYDVSLVLICDNRLSALDEGGPVLHPGAFETLYPTFERRTWRIAAEKTTVHTRALVYLPSVAKIALARLHFAKATIVSQSPRMLLIETGPEGKTGMEMAESLNITYRAKY